MGSMKICINIFCLTMLFSCSSDNSSKSFSSELGDGNSKNITRAPFRSINEYRASLVDIHTSFNPKCRGFITADGSLGPWGKEFVKAMYEVEAASGKKFFFGKDGPHKIKFGRRCKNTKHVNSLTRSQQEHLWVWTWAAIAQSESSCTPTANGRGIWNKKFQRYNKADGLVQLEYYTTTRNASARDKKFCPNKSNTQAIKFQARCAASIMAKAHVGKFLYTEGRSTTYWDKLRRSSGDIFKLLKKHPLCR